MFFSLQQAVTLDVIMSAAFGIQSNFQKNPDDPIMKTSIRAMKPSKVLQFIGNVILPLFPYGREFLSTQFGKSIFFNDLFKIGDVARDVIDIRRKGEVRKVSISTAGRFSFCEQHDMQSIAKRQLDYILTPLRILYSIRSSSLN